MSIHTNKHILSSSASSSTLNPCPNVAYLHQVTGLNQLLLVIIPKIIFWYYRGSCPVVVVKAVITNHDRRGLLVEAGQLRFNFAVSGGRRHRHEITNSSIRTFGINHGLLHL